MAGRPAGNSRALSIRKLLSDAAAVADNDPMPPFATSLPLALCDAGRQGFALCDYDDDDYYYYVVLH